MLSTMTKNHRLAPRKRCHRRVALILCRPRCAAARFARLYMPSAYKPPAVAAAAQGNE